MKLIKLIPVMSILLAACSSQTTEPPEMKVVSSEHNQHRVLDSKTKRQKIAIVNDYKVLQALNYEHIKNNQNTGHLDELTLLIEYFVMDMVTNVTADKYHAALVVRPITDDLTNFVNAEKGKKLVESLLAKHLKEYGFDVFNGRRPKGKFTGEELVFEASLSVQGERLLLDATLKQLNSNKVTSVGQVFIPDYFFKRTQDGVEVYSLNAN